MNVLLRKATEEGLRCLCVGVDGGFQRIQRVEFLLRAEEIMELQPDLAAIEVPGIVQNPGLHGDGKESDMTEQLN